ncbi:MAG: HD domain-containing protein [Spirochaetales bacterium]|nr:HD domain-containing protein [Spirochaetales bacterium]
MYSNSTTLNSLDDIIKISYSGEIETISPEIERLSDIRENDGFHDNDPVLHHVKRVVENIILILDNIRHSGDYFNSFIGICRRKDLLVVSAVFHDIAKSKVFREDDGITSCPGHESAGVEMIREFFAGRHPGDAELDYILKIVEAHGIPHIYLKPDNVNIDRDFDMLAERYSGIYPDLLLFLKADVAGSQLETKNRNLFDFINNYLDKRIEYAFSLK